MVPKSARRLYDRPSAREVDLVDTELLLSVVVADAGVNVVVVQHRAKGRVVVNTLSARTVDPVVGFQDCGSAAFGALLAVLINKSPIGTGGPANLNLVLGALSRPVLIITAALANRKEQVVVLAIQANESSFLCVFTLGFERNVDARSAANRLQGRVLHVYGIEITPEGAKRHDEFGSVPVQGTIDGIVALSRTRRDAGGTKVAPGQEVFASCYTNGRVLGAKRRDAVVEVVGIGNLGDIWSLFFARSVHAQAIANRSPNIPISHPCPSN